MAERTYVAEHVTSANPWDVYALLVDEDQQSQWRTRYETHAPVAEASPYTRVAFEDRFVVELEPEGTGTRLKGTRTKDGDGLGGRITLWLTNRRAMESDIAAQLSRIASSLEFGGI